MIPYSASRPIREPRLLHGAAALVLLLAGAHILHIVQEAGGLQQKRIINNGLRNKY
jgi:hypothetical protein